MLIDSEQCGEYGTITGAAQPVVSVDLRVRGLRFYGILRVGGDANDATSDCGNAAGRRQHANISQNDLERADRILHPGYGLDI